MLQVGSASEIMPGWDYQICKITLLNLANCVDEARLCSDSCQLPLVAIYSSQTEIAFLGKNADLSF